MNLTYQFLSYFDVRRTIRSGETDRDTLKRIQSGEMQYDLEVFAEISDEAKDFISKLLVFSAAGRPDVKTALKHPWLKFADRTPTSVKDRPTDRLKLYLEKFRFEQ